MKVNRTDTNSVQNADVSRVKVTRAPGAKNHDKPGEISSSAGDAPPVSAEISSQAKEFAKAKEVATSAPDVREEKIAALKARIAAGRYNVDANSVADKMVDEHLKMNGMS